MTIDGLNALTALTAGDELPVWDVEASGEEPTKKITAQNMANSVKTLSNLQGTLTFDTTPTTGSTNPVTSGGIKTAIANSQSVVAVGDLITNRSTYFDYQFAKKSGKLVIISFLVKTGTPNGTTLFRIDNSILPTQSNYITPLFYGNGQLNTSGSVWIEYNNLSQVRYYGATATAGAYATLIYMAE